MRPLGLSVLETCRYGRHVKRLLRPLAILLVVVLVVALGVEVVLDRPCEIGTYRAVDDHTLIVTASTGWLDWTRITSVVESPTAVTIGMKSFRLPLPGTGGPAADFTVTLIDPIDNRTVIDASTGQPISRLTTP
jgi:hypothetical protein